MNEKKWIVRPALTAIALVWQFAIATAVLLAAGTERFDEAVTAFGLTAPYTTAMVVWWFKARDDEKRDVPPAAALAMPAGSPGDALPRVSERPMPPR